MVAGRNHTRQISWSVDNCCELCVYDSMFYADYLEDSTENSAIRHQFHITIKNHRPEMAGFACRGAGWGCRNSTEQLFCGIGRKHMARFTANSVEIQHLKDTEQE